MAIKAPAIPWKAILLESLFVVLGLALALFANSWVDSRREIQRADDAMFAIVEELGTNRTAVHASIEYHAQVLGALRKLSQSHALDSTPLAPWSAFPKGFILPASIARHAWDTASATGSTEHIPYQSLLLAARLQQNQTQYQRLVEQVTRDIYDRIFNGGRDAVRGNWRNHQEVLSILVYRECELAWDYAKALPELSPQSEQVSVPDYCGLLPQR